MVGGEHILVGKAELGQLVSKGLGRGGGRAGSGAGIVGENYMSVSVKGGERLDY